MDASVLAILRIGDKNENKNITKNDKRLLIQKQ